MKGEYLFEDARGNRIARHKPQSAVQVSLNVTNAGKDRNGGQMRFIIEEMIAEVTKLTYSETVGMDEEVVQLTMVRHGEVVNEICRADSDHWTAMCIQTKRRQ